LIEMEELKWRQRAQQNWLQYGDKNSKYLHACVNQRRKTNLIQKIRSVEEVKFFEPRNIEVVFLSYYKDLFRSRRLEEVEELLSGLKGRVSAEMNAALLQPCSL